MSAYLSPWYVMHDVPAKNQIAGPEDSGQKTEDRKTKELGPQTFLKINLNSLFTAPFY